MKYNFVFFILICLHPFFATACQNSNDQRVSMPPTVVWLTGLPCSGKTTIAEELHQQMPMSVILDGDAVRKNLNKDLGFSTQDRKENLRRISEVARIILESVPLVIISVVSPKKEARNDAREMIEKTGARFVEVYVNAPLEVCIERDVKGLYRKAIEGEIPNFTGIGAPYQIPDKPNIICQTDCEEVKESAYRILSYIK